MSCSHLQAVKTAVPRAMGGCEECLQMGDSWVHLRLCRTCGHVGCCDDSKNKHATKHFHATQHSDHHLARAGRGLELVLRRRDRDGAGMSTPFSASWEGRRGQMFPVLTPEERASKTI